MILVELVSSISHALPRLVAASARRAPDGKMSDPEFGYAFFRPDEARTTEQFNGEDSGAWATLQSSRLGILGAGPIGRAVARMAHQQFGAEVIYHPWAPTDQVDFDLDARWQPLDDVLAARAICVVLPWSIHLPAQVQRIRRRQISPQLVLVAWRRSPAIERALVYLGQHYIEPVQLCNLAKVACISKSHLVRLFTATLGISPHRYQLLLRLSRAKAMLREGGCITQIAHGVGFFDHSHLDRSFRILTGMTPSQYQQSVAR
jgi:AraC family transcriptional regulator